MCAVLAACGVVGAGCNGLLGNSVPDFVPDTDGDMGDAPMESGVVPVAEGGRDGGGPEAGRPDAAGTADATPETGTRPDGGDGGVLAGDGGDGGPGHPADAGDGGRPDGGGNQGDAGDGGMACPSGQTNCNGTCVDLTTDTANCGSCGTACALGCAASRCTQLTVAGGPITATVGLPLRGVLANVRDATASDPAGALTASIDWGDGATGFGTVSGSAGAFSVTGSHTYGTTGAVTVKVTVNNAVTLASGSAMIPGNVRPAPTLDSFNIATAQAFPSNMALATDGNLWFIESGVNQIARITPTGTINEFVIPTTGAGPGDIAGNPNGEVWFTEQSTNKLGQIIPSSVLSTGTVGEYDLGAMSPGGPGGIIATANGTLWIGFSSPGIASYTVNGPTFTLYQTGNPAATVLRAGADGNVWYSNVFGNAIGKITPTGSVTEYPVTSAQSQPFGVAIGPDGNIWFTENVGNAIGRMTPTGVCTEFPLPSSTSLPKSIIAGPDGNLWFLEDGAENVGRITTTGAITEFPIPVNSQTQGVNSNGLNCIAVGSDGNLWFTETEGERIGRLTP